MLNTTVMIPRYDRFYPSLHRVKEIVADFGPITNMWTELAVWSSLFFQMDDIRFDYNLGGGALIDIGRKCDAFVGTADMVDNW